MAPQVQSLADIMAELSPAYSAGTGVLEQQRAGLGAKYDTQRAGLTAEKGQGFNAINNQATGRGMSFSGIPLDEQATYLSTKYLPAYANTFQQQNDEDLGLQKEAATIGRDQANQALSYKQQQESALNSWNLQQSSQAFQAQQGELDRNARAAEAAASRAASSAAEAPLTRDEYLTSLFADGFSGDNAKNGWTENVAAGNFASAYGLDRKDALSYIYSFRKRFYGQ